MYSYELNVNGLFIERQVSVPVIYKEVKLDVGYRMDILVENKSRFGIKVN